MAGLLLQLALGYRLSYWNRNVFDGFGHRNGPALRMQALIFVLLMGISIVLATLAVWARMTIQRQSRATWEMSAGGWAQLPPVVASHQGQTPESFW